MADAGVDVEDVVGRFEVTMYREGSLIHTALFADLAGAEAFMEEWSEMRPDDRLAVDDRSVDHTGYELVEADTALVDDHELPEEDRYY